MSLGSPSSAKDPARLGNYILRSSSGSFDTSHESTLPGARVECPLSVALATIHRIFQLVARKSGFEIIEEDEGAATAVYRRAFSLKRLVSCCTKCFRSPSAEDDDISAIKLEVELNEAKFMRLAKLRGLYGVLFLFRYRGGRAEGCCGSLWQGLPRLLRGRRRPGRRRTEKGPRGTAPARPNLTTGSTRTIPRVSQRVFREEDQGKDDSSKVSESSSYYIFHKILSTPSYSLGKVHDLLSQIRIEYFGIHGGVPVAVQEYRGVGTAPSAAGSVGAMHPW